jgi:1,4-dihydroxy-2-naphthoate octaprenyltransferase
MGLAVTNAIPDFHQDRLVGKRNLVVWLGREKAVQLYNGLAALALAVAAGGVAAGLFPMPCLLALAAAPLVVLSYRRARHNFESPRAFVPAVRAIVQAYLVAATGFTLGLLIHAWVGA